MDSTDTSPRLMRRFRPSDSSFERVSRPSRTHADPNVSAAYAKLPLKAKLEMNKTFRDNNDNRRIRAIKKAIAQAKHAAAVASTPLDSPIPRHDPEVDEDISDVESDITIDEEVYDGIRTSPELLKEFLPLLDPHTISLMQKINSEDEVRRGNASTPGAPRDISLLSLAPEPEVTLVSGDFSERTPIIFPDIFRLTVKVGFVYPLAFFAPNTIDTIVAKLHIFKKAKVKHNSAKVSVLDIDDMVKKLKEERDVGPTKDVDLSYTQWLEAMQNHYLFEVQRYGDPESARPKFIKQHYGFFKNQQDTEKYFSLWLPHEIKIRTRHYGHNEFFGDAKY